MKGEYPDEEIVRALRDASGLGGAGVERNAAFNRWTLDTTRNNLVVLRELGWVAVPVAAAQEAGLLPTARQRRAVPTDVR